MVKRIKAHRRPPKTRPATRTSGVGKGRRRSGGKIVRSAPPDDDNQASPADDVQVSQQGAPDAMDETETNDGVTAPIMRTRTRKIAKSVTRKRWTVLSPESRAQAMNILRDIQRPVLMAIKNEKRRTIAQSMIEHTINRIDMQLRRIPLPIGSKDRHFNFEKIIDENREMEASLLPDLELIGQLEQEIEREKQLLDQDEKQLNNLTKNAARDDSLRKAHMKKMHALLKENISSGETAKGINLLQSDTAEYDVHSDTAISAVMKDLGSHLTTLSANLREMKEVRAWVNRAEELLDEILRRLGGSEGVHAVHAAQVM